MVVGFGRSSLSVSLSRRRVRQLSALAPGGLLQVGPVSGDWVLVVVVVGADGDCLLHGEAGVPLDVEGVDLGARGLYLCRARGGAVRERREDVLREGLGAVVLVPGDRVVVVDRRERVHVDVGCEDWVTTSSATRRPAKDQDPSFSYPLRSPPTPPQPPSDRAATRRTTPRRRRRRRSSREAAPDSQHGL